MKQNRLCYISQNYYNLSGAYKLYFPEKGCHLGTNRSDNET
jgi:hypothetical protein